MEQIRIVKEMRDADKKIRGRTAINIRPRFLVWENVDGARSSNSGRDYQAVLTEIVRIVQPDAPDVPLPPKGKWPKAGCLFGVGEDGCPFSIGWRVHDAQFWNVPQRRIRLSIVADFGSASASEILFERQSVYGHLEESGRPRKGSPSASQESIGATNGEDEEEQLLEPLMLENHPNDSRIKIEKNGVAQALSGRMGTGGNNTPLVLERGIPSTLSGEEITPTLVADICKQVGTTQDGLTVIVPKKGTEN